MAGFVLLPPRRLPGVGMFLSPRMAWPDDCVFHKTAEWEAGAKHSPWHRQAPSRCLVNGKSGTRAASLSLLHSSVSSEPCTHILGHPRGYPRELLVTGTLYNPLPHITDKETETQKG